MDEAHREKWENADRILECRGSLKSPESYYARLEKDGKSIVVRFEAINKMIKSMKFYNSLRGTEREGDALLAKRAKLLSTLDYFSLLRDFP